MENRCKRSYNPTFGDNVIIGGKEIPAGKYGLLSIPGQPAGHSSLPNKPM
ncbi:DUF2911 domain-containing protein [Niabella defluvii]|nr:DUF2911 domain-containing protein [Niabella sp. I65]